MEIVKYLLIFVITFMCAIIFKKTVQIQCKFKMFVFFLVFTVAGMQNPLLFVPVVTKKLDKNYADID